MANLAIKGHPTRGKEVIEILEMLGGKNTRHYGGGLIDSFYHINEQGEINWYQITPVLPFKTFTIEEFLERYPYKVGDKVLINKDKNDVYTVASMIWDSNINMVRYVLKNINGVILDDSLWYAYEMKFAPKEENNEERKYSELRLDKDQDDKLATEATIDGNKITPPENYLIGKITQVYNGMLVEFVKKQSDEVDDEVKYPRTYEECCKVLGCKPDIGFAGLDDDEENLYRNFIILKRCRDAYWKIAGEEMGLWKSWEPDLENPDLEKEELYCIYNYWGKIIKDKTNLVINKILSFPTEEMRDIFFKNFMELIESCKELL